MRPDMPLGSTSASALQTTSAAPSPAAHTQCMEQGVVGQLPLALRRQLSAALHGLMDDALLLATPTKHALAGLCHAPFARVR